ncbi:MAG: type II secretion system protein N [Proteobacteria bacterium]|nr:type II secretion system protein N [Pseudomonadota bacterium]
MLTLMAVLFAFTVLVRAPARWLQGALPAGVECRSIAGSLWHGRCARLQLPGAALDGVSWTLHAWPLLLGHVDVDLQSADAVATGAARVSLGLGGLRSLRGLHAQLPIESGRLPLFPAGWAGRLDLDFDAVDFDAGRITRIVGVATARELEQRNPPLPFGSYELRFAPAARDRAGGDAPLRGELRDLGGPLAVSGALTVRNGREYALAGLVATRPTASAELARLVDYLGAADAQGRRSFTLEGSF